MHDLLDSAYNRVNLHKDSIRSSSIDNVVIQ